MRSLWFNADTFGAFIHDLPIFKSKFHNVLSGSIASGHSTRVSQHCLQVRGQSQECKELEYNSVD